MEETNKITQAHQDYRHAADAIKEAILNAQYEAARGVNSIQLMLYFAIGRFISQNTRKGKWGTKALGTISKLLKDDMPGLRGYSETNLKRMRTFYEEWSELDSFQPMNVDCNSPIQKDELEIIQNQHNTISTIQMGEIETPQEISMLPFNFPSIDAFPANDFRSIGFTHHSNILAQCKQREQRFFYISLCALNNQSFVYEKDSK